MSQDKFKTWRDIPLGGTIELAGSSADNQTGSWSALKPEIDPAKCTTCGLCAAACPEGGISRNAEAKKMEIAEKYCKGCNLCAAACPKNAIQLKPKENR